MGRAVNIKNKIFGRVQAKRVIRVNGRRMWECACICGKKVIASVSSLRSGNTASCGCKRNEKTAKLKYKHGMATSPEFITWQCMLNRCFNKNEPSYGRYGGAGITVCEEWRNDFISFFKYIGPRPTEKHSVDRFPNPHGNYEPGNVRWATAKEQSRNQIDLVRYSFNGKSLLICEWAEELGIEHGVLRRRKALGWSVERMLTEPVRRKVV